MNIKINRLLLVLFLVSGIVMVSLAQQPKSATDPAGNTSNQTSLSSTNNSTVVAPVPEGSLILLVLAAIYGGFKSYKLRKCINTV